MLLRCEKIWVYSEIVWYSVLTIVIFFFFKQTNKKKPELWPQLDCWCLTSFTFGWFLNINGLVTTTKSTVLTVHMRVSLYLLQANHWCLTYLTWVWWTQDKCYWCLITNAWWNTGCVTSTHSEAYLLQHQVLVKWPARPQFKDWK